MITMNPYSGFKRGRNWDEAEPSSFGSPKLGRFDDGGAMSRPMGGQQFSSQGYRGFRGEPSGNFGQQDLGWSQGASGGGGSGGRGGFGIGGEFGGGGGVRSLLSQGGDNFGDYSDFRQGGQRERPMYIGDGGGYAGRSDDDGFFSQGGGGGPRSGSGGGYDSGPQFGQGSSGGGGFNQGGGGFNQGGGGFNQKGGGGGWGGGRTGFGQRDGGQRGGDNQGRGGPRGRGQGGFGGRGGGGRGRDGGGRGRDGGGRGRDGGGRGRDGGGRGRGGRGRDGSSRGGRGNGGGRGGRMGARGGRGGGPPAKEYNNKRYRRNEHSLLQYSSKFNENKLSMELRFANLCKKTKPRLTNMPKLFMASTALEKYLLMDNICLTPAYVFKGERTEDMQPFNFRCKVFINNIFIAAGVASSKKEAKNKACEEAIKVLATKNSQVIMNTHEKVNVNALGKQDADIVECPLSSGESNIGNILSVPESKKSLDDFYILEPEEVDKSTGMNSTCILRQSADFSHLLLKYEFTLSDQGFLCTVNIEGKTVATAAASQQITAKNLASHAALENLRRNNWTILIIKRDKPTPAQSPLTATFGRIRANDPNSHQHFTQNLRDYLGTYFAGLADYTKWLSLSQELDRTERDAVYNVAKEMNLRVESKRVDGARGKVGENDPMFLVVSKKLLCQDLFDYIWEKGGETWRYKLRAPGEIAPKID